jgi:hypothetical protein
LQENVKSRATLLVTQNALSYEIEKYEHLNRRMVPKLVSVKIEQSKGWRGLFGDLIPKFVIVTKTLTG